MSKKLVYVEEVDGAPVQSEVTPDDLVDIVKNHKLYQKVSAEAIERRQKLKERKEKPDEPAVVPPVPAPVATPSPDELYADFKARLDADNKRVNDERQKRDAFVAETLKKYNLTGDDAALAVVREANDPETAASNLAKFALKFTKTEGSGENPALVADDDPLMQRMERILNLK